MKNWANNVPDFVGSNSKFVSSEIQYLSLMCFIEPIKCSPFKMVSIRKVTWKVSKDFRYFWEKIPWRDLLFGGMSKVLWILQYVVVSDKKCWYLDNNTMPYQPSFRGADSALYFFFTLRGSDKAIKWCNLLSGTNCHKTGMRTPSCTKPRELTVSLLIKVYVTPLPVFPV